MDLPRIGDRVEIDPRAFPDVDVERFGGTVIGYATYQYPDEAEPSTRVVIDTGPEGSPHRARLAHPDGLRVALSPAQLADIEVHTPWCGEDPDGIHHAGCGCE